MDTSFRNISLIDKGGVRGSVLEASSTVDGAQTLLQECKFEAIADGHLLHQLSQGRNDSQGAAEQQFASDVCMNIHLSHKAIPGRNVYDLGTTTTGSLGKVHTNIDWLQWLEDAQVCSSPLSEWKQQISDTESGVH